MIQEVLSELQKKVKVAKSLHNDFAKFNYRNVESIYEAVKPLLPKGYFLTLSDDICLIGDRFYVKSTATLSNGKESISTFAYARECEERKGMDSAQITGSCSSYARKYALGGLLLLDDSKDIDSQDNTQQPQASQKDNPPAQKKQNELLQVKREIAKKLKDNGIVKSNDISDYFSFVGIDKNDLQQLSDLLHSEYFEASISDFIGRSVQYANEGH